MQNDAPRYRYGFFPTAPDANGCALSIGIRRVDGDPDGGPFLQRTSSDGIGLDELLADLREMLSALSAANEPVRTWAFEGINGPFVMRETKTGRRLGVLDHEQPCNSPAIDQAEGTP